MQQIEQIMQVLNADIQYVFREANQPTDRLANEACEHQSIITIHSESQLSVECWGTAKVDKIRILTLRIRTKSIIIQAERQ